MVRLSSFVVRFTGRPVGLCAAECRSGPRDLSIALFWNRPPTGLQLSDAAESEHDRGEEAGLDRLGKNELDLIFVEHLPEIHRQLSAHDDGGDVDLVRLHVPQDVEAVAVDEHEVEHEAAELARIEKLRR